MTAEATATRRASAIITLSTMYADEMCRREQRKAKALTLGDRICNFLLSCGGAYKRINGDIEFSIFYCLGSKQYVMKEENGKIIYFACYWKVHEADIKGVMDRIKPVDISHGSVVYIAEMGNKAGRRGMTEMIAQLRQQNPDATGVFWHRPVKQDKIYHFPHQRGKEA